MTTNKEANPPAPSDSYDALELLEQLYFGKEDPHGINRFYTQANLYGTDKDFKPEIIFQLFFHTSRGRAEEFVDVMAPQDPAVLRAIYIDMIQKLDISNQTNFRQQLTLQEETELIKKVSELKAPCILLVCAQVRAGDESTPRSSLLLFHTINFSTTEALEEIQKGLDSFNRVLDPVGV